MSGRRYLISTVEKLRKGLPDLAPQVEKLTASIDSISTISAVGNKLNATLGDLGSALEEMKTLSSNIASMKNDITNMSNNIMAFRPILDSIRDYSQRNENGLRGIAQALQTIMGQLGEVLAKLG
ncbi:MAG: hypothetical protein ACTSQJ_17090 [Promethearchaeota archaeon]